EEEEREVRQIAQVGEQKWYRYCRESRILVAGRLAAAGCGRGRSGSRGCPACCCSARGGPDSARRGSRLPRLPRDSSTVMSGGRRGVGLIKLTFLHGEDTT